MSDKRAKLSTEDQEFLLALTDKLISIRSVKGIPTPAAPYGEETLHALEFILSTAEQYGFTVKNIDGRVGYIEWGNGKEMLGILCHLDVVPEGVGWSCDPFSLHIQNERLYGRGIADDKGPALCILMAMIRLKRAGIIPTCRVRLILGLDEECGSSCIEHYVSTSELPTLGFTPDAEFPAIFAEKGILQVRIQGKSSGRFLIHAGDRPNMIPGECTITTIASGKSYHGTGIPGHASKPELGGNAIINAVRKMPPHEVTAEPILQFINTYFTRDENYDKLFGKKYHDISGPLTINPGVLHVNETETYLLLDIRYPVTADMDELLHALQSQAENWDLQAIIHSHQRPLYLEKDSQLIQTLMDVYDKYKPLLLSCHQSKEAEGLVIEKTMPIAIGGGTYARTMKNIVAFGPHFPWEPDSIHQADESISKETYFLLAPLYEDAILRLMNLLK